MTKCLGWLRCLLWHYLCCGTETSVAGQNFAIRACIHLIDLFTCLVGDIDQNILFQRNFWEVYIIQTALEKCSFNLFELLCKDVHSIVRGSSLLVLLPMGLTSFHEAIWENNHFLWDAFIIMLCFSTNQIK